MAVGDYQDGMEELYGSEKEYQAYIYWKTHGMRKIKELQVALREALDGWHYAINGFGPEPHDIEELDKFLADLDWPSKRIEFLRSQFLDDK